DKPIEIFINNKDLSEYFEKVMSELRNWVEEIDLEKKVSEQEFLNLTNLAANYIIGDFWALFEQASILEFERRITPENFAELIKMIYKGEISSKIAKQVLKEMFDKKADPSHIVEEKKLVQITDTNEIEKIIKEVINNNPKPVEDYRKGKGNALQYLAGQVMAATQGRAKPETVQEILKEQLKQSNL
ncbi:MAG TPA: Asp-tRNA(Asn)/Glu-tRNA(Gln) amidotransferase subunit GatB, partial [Candidatus Lokiarchaeia archaeon]